MGMDSEDVVDLRTLGNYAREQLGTQFYPRDASPASGRAEEFFKDNPGATWETLTWVVKWCKVRGKHPGTLAKVINNWRYAKEDGFLKRFEESRSEEVEKAIKAALRVETDVEWRVRLLYSEGIQRKVVLEQWQSLQESLKSPVPPVRTVNQLSLDGMASSAENS